jgi:hypothetical protein
MGAVTGEPELKNRSHGVARFNLGHIEVRQQSSPAPWLRMGDQLSDSVAHFIGQLGHSDNWPCPWNVSNGPEADPNPAPDQAAGAA